MIQHICIIQKVQVILKFFICIITADNNKFELMIRTCKMYSRNSTIYKDKAKPFNGCITIRYNKFNNLYTSQ